jgi:F-type H+-transporting ATPase subunit delta
LPAHKACATKRLPRRWHFVIWQAAVDFCFKSSGYNNSHQLNIGPGRQSQVAANASVVGNIAERYGLALYELADEAKSLDEVASDLESLKALIAESDDLTKLLRSPVIDLVEKTKAINTILEKGGANALTRRFVGVVAENNRLFVLAEMITAYLAELSQRRGEITAEVTSARALNDEQLQQLTESLRAKLGGKVAVEPNVDPSLIGGLVVRVGSRMIDASLKTKLQRLQSAMKGA